MAKEKEQGESVYLHARASPQIVFSLCCWHKVKAVNLQLFSHSKNLRRYRLKSKRAKSRNQCEEGAEIQCSNTKPTMSFVIDSDAL